MDKQFWQDAALTYARALVNVMSTMKDHEIKEETGLPDDVCDEIANARAEAEILLAGMKAKQTP